MEPGWPTPISCRWWIRYSARCLAPGPTRRTGYPPAAGDANALLLDVRIPGGRVTEAGVRGNVSVGLQYLEAWLGGSGAVAINNMMEDTATAEIARAQLWQWIHHGAVTDSGRPVTLEGVRSMWRRNWALMRTDGGGGALEEAAELLQRPRDRRREFPEFLTLAAYGDAVGWELADNPIGPLGRLGSNQQPPG